MAQLIVTNVWYTDVDWFITGLGKDWNRNNYWAAGFADTPVVDGQTHDALAWDWVYAPPTGESRATPNKNLNIFQPGTTYTRYGIFQENIDGVWRWFNAGSWTFTTRNPRPAPFFWDPDKTKSQGGNFIVGATEWNRLCNNIDAVRYYRNGSSPYGFTTAYTGINFEAYMYRQCVNAIGAMVPPVSAPPLRYTDDGIKADDINRLQLSINSIS